MPLFTRIPQRFFTILTSAKKELYVEALFVLRQAFKTELVIRREELTAMLVNSLETSILQALQRRRRKWALSATRDCPARPICCSGSSGTPAGWSLNMRGDLLRKM